MQNQESTMKTSEREAREIFNHHLFYDSSGDHRFKFHCHNPDKLVLAITAALRERDEKVEKLEEQRIMELAAISTATFQNTESTVKDRIDRINPYYTVAYGDVCRAIDREMNLRAKLAEAEKWMKHLPNCAELDASLPGICDCGLDAFKAS